MAGGGESRRKGEEEEDDGGGGGGGWRREDSLKRSFHHVTIFARFRNRALCGTFVKQLEIPVVWLWLFEIDLRSDNC